MRLESSWPSKTVKDRQGAFCSRQLQAACTLLDKCIQVRLQVLLWEVTSRWNRFVFDCHVCGFVLHLATNRLLGMNAVALLHFGISNSLSAFQCFSNFERPVPHVIKGCLRGENLTADFSRYSPSFVDTWYGAYHGMFASAGVGRGVAAIPLSLGETSGNILFHHNYPSQDILKYLKIWMNMGIWIHLEGVYIYILYKPIFKTIIMIIIVYHG